MGELVAQAHAEAGLLRIAPLASADLTETLRMLRRRQGFGAVRRAGRSIVVPSRDVTWLLEPGVADECGIRLSPDAARALEVRRRIASVHGEEFERLSALRRGGEEEARRLLAAESSSRPLDALDAHQVVNVAAMTSRDGYGLCLFDEQGAGKTVSVIYAFDRLVDLDLADTAVVVSPKSMVGEWVAAFGEFMGDLYKIAIVTGSRADRIAALGSGADVLVVNYEAVHAIRDGLVSGPCRMPNRAVLVVDESFNVKNPRARRTQNLLGIRDWFGRTWVLCGTPAPNTARDVVAQVGLVDLGQTFADVRIPDDPDKALPVVRTALEQALVLRSLKSDVLPELPAKTFTTVRVPFAPRQRALYEGVLGSLVEDVTNLDDRTFSREVANFLARRMMLLRIASNPAAVDSAYDETPAKLLALDAILGPLVEDQREKVVVWSCFTASLEALLRRYDRYGVVRYDGAVTSVSDRREAVRRFQEDPDVSIFLANAAAAGAGLTLHAARYAIYESLDNRAAHFLQSVDRIHRRGQTRAVEYIVLMCEGSIEELEFERLTAKEAAARDLLRDDVAPPLTRDAFLADLQRARELLSAAAS